MIVGPIQGLREQIIGLQQAICTPLLCLLLSAVVVSCASTANLSTTSKLNSTISNSTTTSGIPQKTRILLVNTNRSIERYRIAEASFTTSLKRSLTANTIDSIDLEQNPNPIDTLQDLLNAQHYDAVYTIGAKALGSIDYIDPDIPIIFSSVLNWRRFDAQENYYGIASEVASEAQFAWFKYFFPKVKRVGVLYSHSNQMLVQSSQQSARKLNIELITKEVRSEAQLLDTSQALLSQVDALWLISDPTVLASTQNAKSLFTEANKHQIPVFTYNAFFVAMGATLSITADLPTTGRQAALMMKNVLKHSTIEKAIQFPAGSSITLNVGKADVYKLKLNNDALDSVDVIVWE